MIRGVAGRGDGDNVSGIGQPPAAGKRAKRLRRKIKRPRIEPRGPPMRKVSAYTPGSSACRPNLAGRNEDFAVREMDKAAVVIHVQMAENDFFHVPRSDAECAQLGTDLLVTINPERDFPSHIGMIRPPGFEQMRSLAGVDDDDPSRCSIAHA
jgi:hypothetical protein